MSDFDIFFWKDANGKIDFLTRTGNREQGIGNCAMKRTGYGKIAEALRREMADGR